MLIKYRFERIDKKKCCFLFTFYRAFQPKQGYSPTGRTMVQRFWTIRIYNNTIDVNTHILQWEIAMKYEL